MYDAVPLLSMHPGNSLACIYGGVYKSLYYTIVFNSKKKKRNLNVYQQENKMWHIYTIRQLKCIELYLST